jgi:hypothetical protein
VLGNTELQQLNIRGFEDYIEMLPTVSYTSNGPGYGVLYMRGISSGGDGVHSGSMPSVRRACATSRRSSATFVALRVGS